MARLDSVGMGDEAAGASSGAEQLAVTPLLEQDQAHGPAPVTALAVPAEHRLADGALLTGTPSAAPHAAAVTADVTFASTPQLASTRKLPLAAEPPMGLPMQDVSAWLADDDVPPDTPTSAIEI